MDLGIKGRVAVVAASSRGLGRACADSLAREGARVVISGRDQSSLELAERQLRERGGEVTSVCCDVTEPDAPELMVRHANEVFGPVDIVVTNAGGPPQARALDLDDEAIFASLNANFVASVRLARAALPQMRERGWGRICCIASASIRQAIPSLPMSNSSRIALWAWVKVAARELAGSGVTVNVACPGTHATERMQQLGSIGTAGDLPMGDPADFGDAVAFLCSQSARYVNGAALVVDGGATLAL